MGGLRWVGERQPFVVSRGEVEEPGLVAEMKLVVGCCYGVVGVALAWLPYRQKARLCQRVPR
jgi:hypothetical protein